MENSSVLETYPDLSLCIQSAITIPYTAWLINSRSVFLTALETGKSTNRVLARFSIW